MVPTFRNVGQRTLYFVTIMFRNVQQATLYCDTTTFHNVVSFGELFGGVLVILFGCTFGFK